MILEVSHFQVVTYDLLRDCVPRSLTQPNRHFPGRAVARAIKPPSGCAARHSFAASSRGVHRTRESWHQQREFRPHSASAEGCGRGFHRLRRDGRSARHFKAFPPPPPADTPSATSQQVAKPNSGTHRRRVQSGGARVRFRRLASSNREPALERLPPERRP